MHASITRPTSEKNAMRKLVITWDTCRSTCTCDAVRHAVFHAMGSDLRSVTDMLLPMTERKRNRRTNAAHTCQRPRRSSHAPTPMLADQSTRLASLTATQQQTSE